MRYLIRGVRSETTCVLFILDAPTQESAVETAQAAGVVVTSTSPVTGDGEIDWGDAVPLDLFAAGQHIPVKAILSECTFEDLNLVSDNIALTQDPIARHFRLQEFVRHTHALRKTDERIRTLCVMAGEQHLRDFPCIFEALKACPKFGYASTHQLPVVTTFAHLATVLAESGDIDRAIEVCNVGLRFGVSDGTKGGLSERLKRLENQRTRARNGRTM